MTQSTPSHSADTSISKKPRLEKSHDLLTCTVKNPQFSYALLELVTDNEDAELDNLQVQSYCNTALRQFLGITGAAIPIDVLKVQGKECWVRVPQPELGAFAAGITAWRGTIEDGAQNILRLKQCSDYLGSMVGGYSQDTLWNS
ncbi:unnamed protein product [Clonostachys rosea f. rosea IK726]|uniref:Ribonucleases P/MRP subunit Pop8-like domain-containing protein n=2 Tax=Bionectria ochroleuca TaxID=29856 RepID=A0A0B7JWB7_BIOOC|nr:unnamed protein product [Clonostachys rosea f. rosea IK726]